MATGENATMQPSISFCWHRENLFSPPPPLNTSGSFAKTFVASQLKMALAICNNNKTMAIPGNERREEKRRVMVYFLCVIFPKTAHFTRQLYFIAFATKSC